MNIEQFELEDAGSGSQKQKQGLVGRKEIEAMVICNPSWCHNQLNMWTWTEGRKELHVE